MSQLRGNWPAVIVIFLVGYVLTVVRHRTDSLIPSVIIHTAYNAMIFGISAIGTVLEHSADSALIDVAFVEAGALARNEPCVGDDASEFAVVGAIASTGRADHVLFDHDAAHVVHAESQAHLANLQSDREPRDLDVVDVVEIDAAEGQHSQILGGGYLGKVSLGKFGIFGLERPGNECGKASCLVLERAELLEMIDAVADGFTNASHHRAGCAEAQLVSFAVNHDPLFAGALQGADIAANFVVQNLATPAGHGIQTCGFQTFESLRRPSAVDTLAILRISEGEKQWQ